MFDPIIIPNIIFDSLLRAEVIPMNVSGNDVDNPIKIEEITKLFQFKNLAILTSDFTIHVPE